MPTSKPTQTAQRLDDLLEEFMAEIDAYAIVAAALERLTDAGASREQAMAALVRWAHETANEWEG
jgi:hypothetical protein